MYKKIFLIITIITIIILSCGCWDKQEPERRAMVIAVGYDYNLKTDRYKLIVQFENSLVAVAGAGGGEVEAPPFWTVSAWGKTPVDAIANIRKKVSREVYYGHLQLLIISESMVSEKGIVPVLDALSRTRQSRPIVYIAVGRGDVEDILNIEYPIEFTNALGLLNQINITKEELGSAIVQNGRQFLNKISTPGVEPVAIFLELINTEDVEQEMETDTEPGLKLTGLAAFFKDKMVGVLEDSDTRGWNWVSSQEVANSFMTFKYPDSQKENSDEIMVTVSCRRVMRKVVPYFKENNQPAVKIELEVIGRIESITGLSYFKEESDITKSLEKRMAEAVRNDIRSALSRAQDLQSDIFGFGNSFYRLEYDKWLEIKDDWKEIFTELPVEIEVKTVIKRSGLVNRGIILR